MNEPINFQEETSKELQAFKLGVLYCSWLYSGTNKEDGPNKKYSSRDIALFLEMESDEVDETDLQNFKAELEKFPE
jgi:hypothetical protein